MGGGLLKTNNQLERFTKDKKSKKIICFVLGIVLIIGCITFYKTFAFYKEEAVFNVIRGRVPNFVANDLMLAIQVDGQTVDKTPIDRKGYKVQVQCDHTTGEWDYEKWTLQLGEITERTKCSINFESIYTIYVNGEQVNAFPSQGNYETSMTCDKGSASWNKEEWQPNVSAFDPEMKCDVVFSGKSYLYTSIVVDGKTVDEIPSQGNYTVELTCDGKTEKWNKEKWEPIISQLNKDTTCSIKFTSGYYEPNLNGSDPVLKEEEMIPILIGNGGSVTYADPTTEWYNYETKNWANAVILLDGAKNKYKVGDTISESDIESYFVWIPKYAYKIQSLGTNTTNQPFEIKFGTTNTTNSDTECVAPNVSGENGSCGVGKYMTHPAFTSFGDIKGLWVGKFETGYKGSTDTASAQKDEKNPTKVQIKPNVNSWRYITNSNMFKTSYNYKRNLDSHMMKNTEWGAVAYLTHSIYGKCSETTCEEVYINNNSNFLTGWSGTSVSASSSTSSGYAYSHASSSTSSGYAYSHASSVKASSTGNYSGIYDLSGGAYDRVAGVRESLTSGSAGFTSSDISTYNKKYYDTYSTSTDSQSTYTTRILGDATAETKGWNGDSAGFAYSSYPWFVRGGSYDSTFSVGVFHFSYSSGGTSSYNSFRVVLAY